MATEAAAAGWLRWIFHNSKHSDTHSTTNILLSAGPQVNNGATSISFQPIHFTPIVIRNRRCGLQFKPNQEHEAKRTKREELEEENERTIDNVVYCSYVDLLKLDCEIGAVKGERSTVRSTNMLIETS